ncbi:MAG: hypothetical protein ACPLZD_04225 [Candidatus Saccharicenans sp.]
MENKNKEKVKGQADKNKGHFLDLKKPIGWLFTYCGLILVIYGLLTGKELYTKSLGININLLWGMVILTFGLIFLLLSYIQKNVEDDSH